MSSNEFIVKKSKLFWFFTFDILKLKKPTVREISKIMAESSLVRGWSYYHTPEERHDGIGTVVPKEEDSSDNLFNNSNALLTLLQDADFRVLDEEYFESQNYTRFHLHGFKIRLPTLENAHDVSVIYTLTKWGVGCLSFVLEIEEDLTPAQLAKLQITPKMEDENLAADLSFELIEEVGYYESQVKDILAKRKEAGKSAFRVKNVSLGTIVGYYIYSLIN